MARKKSELLDDLLADLPAAGPLRMRKLEAAAARLTQLPDPPPNLVLPITRRLLLDLYEGFAALGFRGRSGVPARLRPPALAAQQRLTAALKRLAILPAARQEAFHWSLTALRGRLNALLRSHLASASRTWNPLRLLNRLGGQVALALLGLVSGSASGERPQHEFGLTVLHLLLEADPTLPSQTFSELLELARRWGQGLPFVMEGNLRDLWRALTPAHLTPAQCEALAELILPWSRLEEFPTHSPTTRRELLHAELEADQTEGLPRAALLALSRLLPDAPVLPETDDDILRRDRTNRHATLTLALGVLARSDERFFPHLLAELHALFATYDTVEAGFALFGVLDAFLERPAWLEPLAVLMQAYRWQKFEDIWQDDLELWSPLLSAEALEALYRLATREENAWAGQILGAASGLTDESRDLFLDLVRHADDSAFTVLLPLVSRLRARGGLPPAFDSLLLERMFAALTEGHLPPEAWTRGLLEGNEELLRALLLRLYPLLADSASAAPPAAEPAWPFPSARERRLSSPPQVLLRTLAEQANEVAWASPLKLAACWLADPEDRLGSGLPLAERLRLAGALLRRGREQDAIVWLERALPPAASTPEMIQRLEAARDYPALKAVWAHPSLAPVLLEDFLTYEGLRSGAARRLALTRTLAALPPDLALPVLRRLFDLACEMYRAWYESDRLFTEFYRESNDLAAALRDTLFALQPLQPETVLLLRDLLLSSETLPEGGFTIELSPGALSRTMSTFAARTVSPEAIERLLEWFEPGFLPLHNPYKQTVSKQLALLALSNVSNLSPAQREALWRVGCAAPDMHTRSLSLLVLGRQRPLDERAWRTVLDLLSASWLSHYRQRTAEVRRLQETVEYPLLLPGDVFLLLGTAVAVSTEWSREVSLSQAQRASLRRAWDKAASEINRIVEARLAESTHPHLPTAQAETLGLARSLCDAVGKSPDDDPDWLTRPAALALELLT
jgi:hypothetical protein